MEAELRARLVSTAAVTAIVPADQILWAERRGLPAIRLSLISEQHGHTYAGPEGIANALVQIDCFAATADAAHDLGAAVRAALDGFRGALVRGAFLSGRRMNFEPESAAPEAATPAGIHWTSLDFRVWHTAT